MPETGPVRAGAHIGGGAGDGAGGADAAEQRRADVGEALRHQFAVGAVPPAGHAVGDDGGQQRFDRAQQREGDGVGQHRRSFCRGDAAAVPGIGRAARNAAKARADGVDRQRKQRDDQRGQRDGDQHGPASAAAPLQSRRSSRWSAPRRQVAAGLTVRQASPERDQLRNERARLLARQRQPEQVLDLAGEDDDGDAGGEARRSPDRE